MNQNRHENSSGPQPSVRARTPLIAPSTSPCLDATTEREIRLEIAGYTRLLSRDLFQRGVLRVGGKGREYDMRKGVRVDVGGIIS